MITAHDVAREIRNQLPDAGRVKVQKLLYYAQGYHLAIHREPLFDDEIQAWQYGPVVPSVYRADRYGQSSPIPAVALDDRQMASVQMATGRFGGLFATELIAMTHAEAPWIDAKRQGGLNTPLDQESIGKYFRGHKVLDWDDDGEPDEMPAVVADEFDDIVALDYDSIVS